MCQLPCGTCPGGSLVNFNNCLTCHDSSLILKNGLCIKQPTFIIQIVCTFLLIIFVLPNLMRKRSVTLMRIFDAIQIVFYFKYINGYLANRHNYLYLGMRAWSQWSEGWKLISLSNQISLPIWIIEQTSINKIIRICVIWGGVVIVMFIMGLLKTMMGDSQITFSAYICKNFPIALSLGFYINIQDMSLIMANSYNSSLISSPFSNIQMMIQFAVGIIFALIALIIMVWMFYTINYDYILNLDKTPRKIYPHVYMFMLALDYDFFQTYQLTSLPQKEKKIYRYSNIRLIQIFKKIAYSFLIVNSLYSSKQTLNGEIFSIIGFLIFFDIVWYVGLPYDLQSQKIQFIISILADILTIAILAIPLIMPSQMIEMILCLALFGLAIVSVILQYFLDVYNIIPVDLYETGLNVVIEDKKLLKQLEQRKRLQQEHERMMKQIQMQNKKLRQQLEAQKNKKQKLKDETQNSLPNINENNKQNDAQDNINDKMSPQEQQQDIHENTQMNSDDAAQLYRIDEGKRRKIYQYNKKTVFTYSNKVEY